MKWRKSLLQSPSQILRWDLFIIRRKLFTVSTSNERWNALGESLFTQVNAYGWWKRRIKNGISTKTTALELFQIRHFRWEGWREGDVPFCYKTPMVKFEKQYLINKASLGSAFKNPRKQKANRNALWRWNGQNVDFYGGWVSDKSNWVKKEIPMFPGTCWNALN